ncbi:unnamed protein product [Discula destructiva]
MGLGLYN